MECRRVLVVLLLVVAVAGCNSSTAPDSAATGSSAASTTTSAAPTEPAAQVAQKFLEAVVQGDTATANGLLTPLAIEKIAASGKPFQLPGLANYTFQVGQVRHPAPDKAFVQCAGTDRSTEGKVVQEDFCWLMSLVDQEWRIAGISYTVGPQQTLMIYSFEDPEKGAIPVQRLMAPTPAPGQTAAAPGQPGTPPQQQGAVPVAPRQSPGAAPQTSRTAQEAVPTGAYR